MRSILVLVEDHSAIESVMASALLVGRRFGSGIDGVPIAPDISDIVVADISIGATIFDQRTKQILTDRAAAHFQAAVAENGYPTGGTGAVATWGTQMTSDGSVGAGGRAAGRIVLGKPGQGGHDPRQATFEAALFESGRPVLIAPPRVPATLGDTILIAWNRSSETARTVGFAMPILAQAKRIAIMTIEVPSTPGPSGTALATTLRRHGIEAEALPVEQRAANEGPAILRKAGELGADLIIKGGSTQSRLRQMIFGGATSHVLAHADVPVFMAH